MGCPMQAGAASPEGQQECLGQLCLRLVAVAGLTVVGTGPSGARAEPFREARAGVQVPVSEEKPPLRQELQQLH